MLENENMVRGLIPWQSKIRILQHDVNDVIGEGICAAVRGRIIHTALSFLEVYRGGIEEIELGVKRAFAADPTQDATSWDIYGEFVLPIARALSIPKAGSWFREGICIMREQEVIDGKGETHRPDRIVVYKGVVEVIDYKAGESPAQKRDIKQVKRYISVLSHIFDGNVRGYLLYIDIPLIVDVQ